MIHLIEWGVVGAARLSIEDNAFTVNAGLWPDVQGVVVAIPSMGPFALQPGDCYIYFARSGAVYITNSYMSYGIDGEGKLGDMMDLIAWKQDNEWHIKRLVRHA